MVDLSFAVLSEHDRGQNANAWDKSFLIVPIYHISPLGASDSLSGKPKVAGRAMTNFNRDLNELPIIYRFLTSCGQGSYALVAAAVEPRRAVGW